MSNIESLRHEVIKAALSVAALNWDDTEYFSSLAATDAADDILNKALRDYVRYVSNEEYLTAPSPSPSMQKQIDNLRTTREDNDNRRAEIIVLSKRVAALEEWKRDHNDNM